MCICEVSWGPEIGYCIHFSHRPVYSTSWQFRCQSGPLTHFAPGDFSEEGDIPFKNVIRRNHLTKMYQQAALSRIKRRNPMVKFSFRHVIQFVGYWLVKLKEFDSRTFEFWSLITGTNIDLQMKTYIQSQELVQNNPLASPDKLYDG